MGRKETPDLMSEILGKKPGKKTVPENTPAAGEMKTFSLRMPEGDRDLLKQYFKSKGMDLSNGLRMWIYERMQQEGLK